MRNELLKIMIYCDILAAKSNLIKVEKDLLCSSRLLHLQYKGSQNNPYEFSEKYKSFCTHGID